jgi:hypothetical protein
LGGAISAAGGETPEPTTSRTTNALLIGSIGDWHLVGMSQRRDKVHRRLLNANWQLFIDDDVIARSTGCSRVIHHPRPMGVVIPADKPWETCGVGSYVTRRADGTFVAFYDAMWWELDAAEKLKHEGFRQDRAHHIFTRKAYATSHDGIHWEKP